MVKSLAPSARIVRFSMAKNPQKEYCLAEQALPQVIPAGRLWAECAAPIAKAAFMPLLVWHLRPLIRRGERQRLKRPVFSYFLVYLPLDKSQQNRRESHCKFAL